MIRPTLQKVALLTEFLTVVLVIGSSSVVVSDEPETRAVDLGDVQLNVPESWKEEKPESRFRLAQLQIPPAEGDDDPAELAVFQFSGGGGGVDANLKRWIGEFSAEGRKIKLRKGTSKNGTYFLSDLTGTYNKRIGPPVAGKTKAMPGSRVLGVILQVPDKEPLFLKFAGPEKTVTEAEKAFKKSFGADAEKEEEYELK